MAFEYFLYTTEFNNTLIDRGANSFAPLPPNTGEIYIDFLIPSIQPLYNYRESGGTIILNDEQTVNNFLNTAFPPTPFEPIDNQTFTGFTAQTETQYNNLVASLSGISTGETISAIAIHTDASANLTLTNQVSGITFLGNSNRNIVKVDLTNTRQIKLVSRIVTGSNSVLNPRLQLLFSPTFSTTVTNYTNIGISNIENSLVSATYADSGWIDLASSAKTEGFVTVSQIGGNAAADPALGYIYVFLKNIVQTTDSITQATFSGFTATTQNQINNKIDKVTGATDFIPQFISNGNIISSGYKISDLTGGTSGNYLPLSGGTITGSLNITQSLIIGSGITPTLNVKANEDIVYINSTGLTGIVALDDLGFYAGGRGAFGNAVTIDRLRASSPSNQPRSLSLIDTNAVMRIWRYVNDTNDPAVEFVWGTEATPATVGNSWWDMFLDGGAAPNDMFSIRRRTENVNQIKLTIGDTVSNFPTTTTSTSPTTGALTVGGGVGIAGALNVGTTISGVTLFENNVSLVNKYLQISNFNTYSGATATAIGLKANIDAPTFTGIPAAPTAAVNTNTTQIATTAFVVGQAANVNPLVNGIVAIGTSLRFARQDHVHPTDTSRQATISGAATTITSNDLTANRVLISDVNGKVAVSTVTSAQLTALTANIYGSQFQLAESLGTSTTTSATPQTKVTLTTPSLPAGTYKIFASWVGNADSATNDMIFDVTLNGTPLGTRTTMNIELNDATTFLPLSRTFYRALSGVNTILLRFSSENTVTTTISDAAIELIRVS